MNIAEYQAVVDSIVLDALFAGTVEIMNPLDGYPERFAMVFSTAGYHGAAITDIAHEIVNGADGRGLIERPRVRPRGDGQAAVEWAVVNHPDDPPSEYELNRRAEAKYQAVVDQVVSTALAEGQVKVLAEDKGYPPLIEFYLDIPCPEEQMEVGAQEVVTEVAGMTSPPYSGVAHLVGQPRVVLNKGKAKIDYAVAFVE